MIEALPTLAFFIGSAIAGDVFMNQFKGQGIWLLASWYGAAFGAAMSLLILSVFFGGLYFFVDPCLFLVQDPLIGGVAGAVVDLPLLIGRGVIQKKPWRQIGGHALLVVAGASICIALIIVFRMNYTPIRLPV